MIVFLICITLFAAWSIFIVNFINNLVYKKLKFIENRDPNIEESFKPFERFERNKWNINEMYFCGIFLLPFRIFTVLFGMILLVLFLFIIVGFKPNAHRQEYPIWKRNAIIIASRIFARIIIFCCGIYWIEKRYAKISDYDKDYPNSYKSHIEKT